MHDMREFPHLQDFEDHTFGTASQPDAWHAHGIADEHQSGTLGLDDVNGLWRSETDLRHLLGKSLEEEDPARLTLRFATSEVPLSRQRHRKVRADAVRRKPTRGETLSFATVVITVAIMAGVCVLGGTVTHDPLRHLAGAEAPRTLADLWPLLVYGPWTVASLSILRAALHQRRAPHSWCVVFLFSAFAIAFCIDQAPRTITSATVASLPTIATLSCFHQLVRQITLTRPPQRGIANRRTTA